MAEFHCFVKRFKEKDEEFKTLYTELKNQEFYCLEELKNFPDEKLREKCLIKKKDFDMFFKHEKKEFVMKSIEICENIDPSKKLDCLKISKGNLLVFKDKIIDRLERITAELSFKNL